MIENGRYADMINELKNKMTDLEKSGPVSQEERDVADTFIQELERHVDGLYC
jgi:hemerythrin-like domain-containing protein